jgi:hypothetical protein
MKELDYYSNAHLAVAAIRVLEYQNGRPPSLEEMCEMLSMSLEQGHLLCNRLNDMGVVKTVDGSYGLRLFVLDHLKLEDIPQGSSGDDLGAAVKQFQESRKQITEKIESIKADQAEKRKNLFAELESKLKKDLGKTS